MITNCYDITKVLAALQGRLAWNQPTLAGSPVLTSQNTTSSTGRYYNDGSFSAACTLQRLIDCQEDNEIDDTKVNALLQTLDKSVISRSLNAVLNRSQLIEHTPLYTRQSNLLSKVIIQNQGNFCGYRIKVAQGDYTVQIDTVGLYFDGVATFNLYLFNDLQSAPIFTQSITTVANSQTLVTLNWVIDYMSTSNMGGIFYLGYFQDDIGTVGVHALDEQLNLWADSKIFGAYPFQSQKVTGQVDFNRINPSVVFRSYGLNLEVSSYRDYTQKIIRNAHLFDELRGLTMAIYVLEQVKNTTRENSTERKSLDAAKLEYDLNLAFPTKDFPFVAGLKAQLNRETKRVNDNFFPKAQAQSVSIGQANNWNSYGYDSFDINNLPPRETLT